MTVGGRDVVRAEAGGDLVKRFHRVAALGDSGAVSAGEGLLLNRSADRVQYFHEHAEKV